MAERELTRRTRAAGSQLNAATAVDTASAASMPVSAADQLGHRRGRCERQRDGEQQQHADVLLRTERWVAVIRALRAGLAAEQQDQEDDARASRGSAVLVPACS